MRPFAKDVGEPDHGAIDRRAGMLNAALQAKKLDEVASGFIRTTQPRSGLDLGAGLVTRMVRIAPPDTVDR
jgi:O-methyltransferase involved in polyketide biosynthesis